MPVRTPCRFNCLLRSAFARSGAFLQEECQYSERVAIRINIPEKINQSTLCRITNCAIMILQVRDHQRHETLKRQGLVAIHANDPVHGCILCSHICAGDDFVTDDVLNVVCAEVPGVGESL